jgi:hypothetical protein
MMEDGGIGMKQAIFAVLQFLLFLVIFAVGSFLPPFHIRQVVGHSVEGTRIFYADGLMLAAVTMLLVLGIEAARKRIRTAGVWTVAAFVLAAALGLAMKFGFTTVLI